MKITFFAISALLILLSVPLVIQQVGETDAEGRENKMLSDQNIHYQKATFAGGCFWCTESDFEKVPGVIEVISGYAGGTTQNPTYEQVSSGIGGHVESVQVTFDPSKVTYEELLEAFWEHIDPTDPGGQFVDRGPQYRSVIFYSSDAQRKAAEASKKKLAESGRFHKAIVTQVIPLNHFYPAETYHQDYYKKNPLRYRFYRYNSGRDQFLKKVWGEGAPVPKPELKKDEKMTGSPTSYHKPDAENLRNKLSALQFKVTQHEGTEPPFKNAYWDNHKQGIYVDIVSGEPLFSSTDKFDSGTGWPSFTRPLEPGNVVEKEDRTLFMVRTEVRSRNADSHLGHVFPDGPRPTGLRYCINSAALRFIPKEDLEQDGYGKYVHLFKK